MWYSGIPVNTSECAAKCYKYYLCKRIMMFVCFATGDGEERPDVKSVLQVHAHYKRDCVILHTKKTLKYLLILIKINVVCAYVHMYMYGN